MKLLFLIHESLLNIYCIVVTIIKYFIISINNYYLLIFGVLIIILQYQYKICRKKILIYIAH
jgi:hypothetical protein